MSFTLYTYPNNPRAWKALVAAEYVGLKVTVPDFTMGVDNKTPAFLKLNPSGKVPTLKTPDGGIFDSNPIARAVCRYGNSEKAADLLGRTAYEEGVIDSWISTAQNELELPTLAWLMPILGYVPYSAEGTRQAKEDINKLLGIYNEHLKTHTYLVGDRVTLADIITACTLHGLYTKVLDEATRRPFPHTNRWFTTIVNQPEFLAVAGPTELTKVQQAYDASKVAAAPAPAAGKGKKEEKKKEEKKTEKAAAPKAEKTLEEIAEEEEKAAAKRKNPLDELPPTEFQLDPFKKLYSNSKNIRKEVCPEFWKQYDPAGYSLWAIKYKYEEELTVGFKAANSIGGWLQRLEKLHKYAFGNILILGGKPHFEIEGVWLFRGLEVPAEVTAGDDHSLYTWRRLDHTSAADRQIVDDFNCWDGPSMKGREVVDGKTFK